MKQTMILTGAVIALVYLAASCFGLWSFVNSSAAEAQAWQIVDGFVSTTLLFGKVVSGAVVILVLAASFWILSRCLGPLARAYATYRLSLQASKQMGNVNIETPEIRVMNPGTEIRAMELGHPPEVWGGEVIEARKVVCLPLGQTKHK